MKNEKVIPLSSSCQPITGRQENAVCGSKKQFLAIVSTCHPFSGTKLYRNKKEEINTCNTYIYNNNRKKGVTG